MDLKAIIELCIQDDRSSQRRLYDSYKDNLYTIAYRLTRDTTAASDLLQNTFIDAFKNLAKLNEPLYFHSWIKQILIRKTYYYLRHVKESVSIEDVTIGHTSDSDIEYIEQAILQLPIKSRTVFVMSEVEGFSHKEIAESMDISVGTSKSQLNYAKTKLKELLKSYMV
jgi:RNA polymerase sigma-70 factor (ECF subfamily)